MLIDREILEDIFKWISREEIVILTGPRQSGKTVLLKIIEKRLKAKDENVVFLNLEDEEILEYLNRTPANLLKLAPVKDNRKIYVILDEIQYLNNPTNFLKLIYDDHREQIKLIVSGSSAFYIDQKFKDSLAGRKKIFYILPLNFTDFFSFKGKKELLDTTGEIFSLDSSGSSPLNIIQQREMDNLIEEYMLYGGYPKIVLETDFSIKAELLQEILNSYIKKDAIEADIRSRDKFFALLRILASQAGSLVNENELANTLAISTSAIRHYLYIMRKSFHIHFVEPYYSNVRKEISKMPKVYLFDTGLRNRILNNFEPIDFKLDKGEIFENFIFKMLADRYGFDTLKFWRSQAKNEVGFILVKEKKAVEVKYNSSLFKPKKYAFFQSKYPDFSFHLFHRQGEPGVTEQNILSHKI
ncbi:MAG: ATP-binding protein [Candidatus Aminicenantes bacterium]|nr:ATP-binding protein [Candidatus Aminicenantes bacterium]